MNAATIVLLAVAAAAAVGDWWAVARGNDRVEHALKPATLAALIAAALVLDPADDAVRWWFVAALSFGLIGDVFLMLPDRFVAGLGSFLVGHLAYIAGLRSMGGGATMWGVAILLLALLAVPLGLKIVAGAGRKDPALRVPVGLYIATITLMVAAAFVSGSELAAVGAASFYASDAMIGWSRFVEARRWMPVAIMVTYHLAQAALVLALV